MKTKPATIAVVALLVVGAYVYFIQPSQADPTERLASYIDSTLTVNTAFVSSEGELEATSADLRPAMFAASIGALDITSTLRPLTIAGCDPSASVYPSTSVGGDTILNIVAKNAGRQIWSTITFYEWANGDWNFVENVATEDASRGASVEGTRVMQNPVKNGGPVLLVIKIFGDGTCKTEVRLTGSGTPTTGTSTTTTTTSGGSAPSVPSPGKVNIPLSVTGKVETKNIRSDVTLTLRAELTTAVGGKVTKTATGKVGQSGGDISGLTLTFEGLDASSVVGTNRINVDVEAVATDALGEEVRNTARTAIEKTVNGAGEIRLKLQPASITWTGPDNSGAIVTLTGKRTPTNVLSLATP